MVYEYLFICSNTLYLKSLDKKRSRIKDVDQTKDVSFCIHKILDINCKNLGSSLAGRIEGSKTLLSTPYKNPIILFEYNEEIIIFAIKSYDSVDNVCFIYNNIEEYKKIPNGVEITFKNNIKESFELSYNVFESQYLKSTLLSKKISMIKARLKAKI